MPFNRWFPRHGMTSVASLAQSLRRCNVTGNLPPMRFWRSSSRDVLVGHRLDDVNRKHAIARYTHRRRKQIYKATILASYGDLTLASKMCGITQNRMQSYVREHGIDITKLLSGVEFRLDRASVFNAAYDVLPVKPRDPPGLYRLIFEQGVRVGRAEKLVMQATPL